MFTTCKLANILSVSRTNATAGDNITITGNIFKGLIKNFDCHDWSNYKGTGFSNASCENQILIGSYSCPLVSSNVTHLICQIDDNSGLVAGVSYLIEVLTKNSGYANKSQIYEFKFLPKVISITPDIG